MHTSSPLATFVSVTSLYPFAWEPYLDNMLLHYFFLHFEKSRAFFELAKCLSLNYNVECSLANS